MLVQRIRVVLHREALKRVAKTSYRFPYWGGSSESVEHAGLKPRGRWFNPIPPHQFANANYISLA